MLFCSVLFIHLGAYTREIQEDKIVNQLALAGAHIWTTKTGGITAIESEIATVTHTRGSPLLEQKKTCLYLTENVSTHDVY